MPRQGVLVEGEFKAGGAIGDTQMEDRCLTFFGLPPLGDFLHGIAALFPEKPGGSNGGAVEDDCSHDGLMNLSAHKPYILD